MIADLIEDGSTIQLGIGGLPGAVAMFLKDKRNLGPTAKCWAMQLYSWSKRAR